MSVQTVSGVKATETNEHGYRSFSLGEFASRRDESFVYVKWPTGRHVLSADGFLRALQRDVAWEFFYGTVNFDGVVGTVNHYGTVDLFAGRYNDAYRKKNRSEEHTSELQSRLHLVCRLLLEKKKYVYAHSLHRALPAQASSTRSSH